MNSPRLANQTHKPGHEIGVNIYKENHKSYFIKN
jgi:hypothetical protein